MQTINLFQCLRKKEKKKEREKTTQRNPAGNFPWAAFRARDLAKKKK